MSMNLIQFRLIEGKPTFWGLVDVKDDSDFVDTDDNVTGTFDKKASDKSFKLCEEKALRIVNPEVLPIEICTDQCLNPKCGIDEHNCVGPFGTTVNFNRKRLKHNDTFPIPEGLEFKVREEMYMTSSPTPTGYRCISLVPSIKEDKERIESIELLHQIISKVQKDSGQTTWLNWPEVCKIYAQIAFNKGFNEGIEAAIKHIGDILERASFMDDYRDGLEKLKNPSK